MAAAHRLFALLLVASTAEVRVFLGALGNAVQLAVGGAARWRGGLIALVASSLAFGFFHLTYPAPWNTISACRGLSVVWAGLSVLGFAQNGIELPGTAVVGWLEATLALVMFTIVFSGVRRGKLRTA